jgi:hypothetical protein
MAASFYRSACQRQYKLPGVKGPQEEISALPTLHRQNGLKRYCTRDFLLATTLQASALLPCSTLRQTSAEKDRELVRKFQGRKDTWGPALKDPTLTQRYLYLPLAFTPVCTTSHFQSKFQVIPPSHLVFRKVQDLDLGSLLYHIRQAIQPIQFVVAQVQGQQLWRGRVREMGAI